MSAIRPEVADLLRAGVPDRTIAKQLHMDSRTVSAARTALGLPKSKPGRKPAATVEELFHARTRPVDGGHLEWTGYESDHLVPLVRHGGRLHTAYRVAYRIRTGREATTRVTPTCGHPGCVAPAHVQDAHERQRTDAAFAAIFGEVSA